MEQVTKFFNRICSDMKIKARALNGDKNMEEYHTGNGGKLGKVST